MYKVKFKVHLKSRGFRCILLSYFIFGNFYLVFKIQFFSEILLNYIFFLKFIYKLFFLKPIFRSEKNFYNFF